MKNKFNIENFKSIKKGNVKSFEILFRAYYKPLLIYCRKIVGNNEDAHEIVQDIFLNIWEKRKEIEIKVKINSYLYKAVYNNSLQFLKRQKLETKYKKYKFLQNNGFEKPNVEMMTTELNYKIGLILDSLPENCKNIFIMNRFNGMKYQEIADKLFISIKTVEANMTKALKCFRENLKEYITK